jgi:hypothetical protein
MANRSSAICSLIAFTASITAEAVLVLAQPSDLAAVKKGLN